MQALVAHAPRDAPPEVRAVAGGRPVSREIEVRVRDEEIQVRGPNVMAGYLGDEEATRAAFTEDGFYRSGDLGRETEHGFAFVARRGDALRLAGFSSSRGRSSRSSSRWRASRPRRWSRSRGGRWHS
jgi:fatty-acyl-CoA synthase